MNNKQHRYVIGSQIFFLLFCIALTGCSPSGNSYPGIDLVWNIEPDPPRVSMSTITLMFTDSTGQPLTGAEIELEANMTHPGMQPVFAVAEETKPGEYSASIEFKMVGDWYILVESTLADGRVVQRRVDVPGVRSQGVDLVQNNPE
jgi:hypothetical protein